MRNSTEILGYIDPDNNYAEQYPFLHSWIWKSIVAAESHSGKGPKAAPLLASGAASDYVYQVGDNGFLSPIFELDTHRIQPLQYSRT